MDTSSPEAAPMHISPPVSPPASWVAAGAAHAAITSESTVSRLNRSHPYLKVFIFLSLLGLVRQKIYSRELCVFSAPPLKDFLKVPQLKQGRQTHGVVNGGTAMRLLVSGS